MAKCEPPFGGSNKNDANFPQQPTRGQITDSLPSIQVGVEGDEWEVNDDGMKSFDAVDSREKPY